MTNRMNRITWIALGVVVVMAISMAGTFLTAGTQAARADVPVLETIDINQSIWWYHLGTEATAVANFGPLLEVVDRGVVRRWTLMVHLPGTAEPLSCVQGLLDVADSSPINAKGNLFEIELNPLPGMGWGDVLGPEDIDALVIGLD